MKQSSSMFYFIIFCLMINACNSITKKQFEFYYYPSRNVYYDVANSMYLYSLDGGQTWDSLQYNSGKEPATLGAKQIIYSISQQVWLDNEQHRNQFNGKAINITESDTALANKNLVAERKVKKAQTSANTVTKQPEKKRSFFQRLFGKKNKN